MKNFSLSPSLSTSLQWAQASSQCKRAGLGTSKTPFPSQVCAGFLPVSLHGPLKSCDECSSEMRNDEINYCILTNALIISKTCFSKCNTCSLVILSCVCCNFDFEMYIIIAVCELNERMFVPT